MIMYNRFAYLYDDLMNDVDYEKWVDYYFKIFRRYGLEPKLGLDLGCGTGNLTTLLAKRGMDMTGVDSSADMLSVAGRKNTEGSILYLNQNMTEFELYGTVDFIVSGLDCINYVTDKRDLMKVFRLANNYLEPGGLFIFDINTQHKLENVLGNNVFIIESENCFCSWQNEYDRRRKICDEGKRYSRFDEVQSERAYSSDEITAMLEKAGMKLLRVYDDRSFDSPKYDSERVFFVAQEQGKKR